MDSFDQILPGFCHILNASNPESLEEREDLLAILDTLSRIDKSNLPPFVLVGVQDGVTCPSLMDSSDFVGDVVGIGDARIETETTGRGKRVSGVSNPA